MTIAVGTEKDNRLWLRRIMLGLICISGVIIAVLFYMIATFDIAAHRDRFPACSNPKTKRLCAVTLW